MTAPEVPRDPLAIAITRLEGKVDLGNERHAGVQAALEELKRTMREDRISGEARMKQHVESPNPHPAQEAWLRELHAAHETRLRTIETDVANRAGEKNGVAPLHTFLWSLASSVVTAGVVLVLSNLIHH